MKTIKCVKHAASMVMHSRLRSWLTIIGIVIGIASVIAIIAIGDGFESQMKDQMGSLETDTFTLSAGYSRGSFMGPGGHDFGGESASSSDDTPELTKKDVLVLKNIPGVEYVSVEISGRAEVTYSGKSGTVSVTGVDEDIWADTTTEELSQGRMFDAADVNVVVIGYSLANEYFDKEVGLNQMLSIEGKSFRVIGILEDGTRNEIYMPIAAAVTVLDDKEKDVYDQITIKVEENSNLTTLEEKITDKLMNSRHVNEKTKDFTLTSSAEMNEMRSEMMSTMTTFLTGIAAISLLVGAIGIANTMFTSVLEKTKQIGIMKAVGARNSDIMKIFLSNAAIIGLIGGVLGIALGYAATKVVEMAGLSAVISLNVVAMAVFVSVFVGMAAGLVPAYQASQLNPVEALRFE